jgi:hypothetical protein
VTDAQLCKALRDEAREERERGQQTFAGERMLDAADRIEELGRQTKLLAEDHRGMKANGSAYLLRNGVGFKGMREEIHRNLTELAKRFYAGDASVCDEFLQLYCYGEQERRAAKERVTPRD